MMMMVFDQDSPSLMHLSLKLGPSSPRAPYPPRKFTLDRMGVVLYLVLLQHEVER